MARSVPDSNNIKLSDVTYAIYGTRNTSGYELIRECFRDAQGSGFKYSGRNSLMDFRGYKHDTTAPGSFTVSLNGLATSTKIPVKWTTPSDDVGIDRYEAVYLDRDRNITSWPPIEISPNTNSYTFSNLSPSTSYRFTITAYDKVGRSSSDDLVTSTKSADSISTSHNSVSVPSRGGSVSISVTSSGSWTYDGNGSGWTALPFEGGSGTTSVTLSCLLANGSINPISRTVTFTCGTASVNVTVIQGANTGGGGGITRT